MPYGKKKAKTKHRDPGADARMKKFESSLRKAMAKPVKKKTAAKKKK